MSIWIFVSLTPTTSNIWPRSLWSEAEFRFSKFMYIKCFGLFGFLKGLKHRTIFES